MKYGKLKSIAFMFERINFWSSMRYLSAMYYGMALKEKHTHKIKRWDRIAEFCSRRYYKSIYDLDWYIKMNLIE